MNETQEAKLDKVLELTARHGVHLTILSQQYQRLADRHDALEGKVIRLETTRDDSGRKLPIKVASGSLLIAAIGAAVSLFQACVGTKP